MDRPAGETDREEDVRDLVEDYGLDATTARFVVALAHGEVDGDAAFAQPLTPEERSRSGVDRGPFADPDDDPFP